MGIPLAIRRAVKLTTVGFILSAFLAFVHPNELKGQMTAWKFITEQILFYMGTFMVFLCWELCHHLHQVSLLAYVIMYVALYLKFFAWISFLQSRDGMNRKM